MKSVFQSKLFPALHSRPPRYALGNPCLSASEWTDGLVLCFAVGLSEIPPVIDLQLLISLLFSHAVPMHFYSGKDLLICKKILIQ